MVLLLLSARMVSPGMYYGVVVIVSQDGISRYVSWCCCQPEWYLQVCIMLLLLSAKMVSPGMFYGVVVVYLFTE